MRLAAQAKMGFYPIADECARLIAGHLALNAKRPEDVHILDPCCGEGLAAKTISEAIRLRPENVHLVELHHERVETARRNLPHAKVVGPAGYLGTRVTPHSFGFIYLNPPFDDEIGGGGREELAFLRRALIQLAPNGVLCLVMPFNKLKHYGAITFLDCEFEQTRVYTLPAEHRKFGECVTFAVKRKVPLPAHSLSSFGELTNNRIGMVREDQLPVIGDRWHGFTPRRWEVEGAPLEADLAVYTIPHTYRPRVFQKNTMTDMEIFEFLRASPLNSLLKSSPEFVPDRPPLPPGRGHVSMLLSSGMLDGVVPAGEDTHVVRGSTRKGKTLNVQASDVTEKDDGTVTVKAVWSEYQDLTIRVVTKDGAIRTYSTSSEEQEGGDPPPTEEG